MERVHLTIRAPLVGVLMTAALAGCSAFGVSLGDDVSGGDVYTGQDATRVIVTTEQIGCCYMEGSLHFAKLEGRSSFDWDVEDGSGGDEFDPDKPYVAGRQTHSVEPGDYTLTAWEEVCDGNCDYLDGPTNHCSLDFSAAPGETVRIRVTFTIPHPCVATVE